MEKVRIMMIGAGNIANTHLQAYEKIPEVEITAICDIDAARMQKTADRFGIAKRYTDLDAMLAENQAEGADVCVWNVSHADCTIRALNAGCSVLCEKPMAMSAAQAKQMKAAADKAGKLLMIGFVLRFSDENRMAKELIDAGLLGDIYYSKAVYLRRHGAPGGWFGDSARSGGGPVIDLGVHVLDQTRFLMGNPMPVSVYASVQHRLGSRPELKNLPGWVPEPGPFDNGVNDVEDFATALIRYDNGAVVSLETSYDLNGENSSKKEIYGTKGGLALSDKPKLWTVMNGYLADVTPSMDHLRGAGDCFLNEMQHFADCLQGRCSCIAPAEDGIVVMHILDAIYESGRTGHEVILKQEENK